jgi:hypothetical protein
MVKNSNFIGLSENSLFYYRQYLALPVAASNTVACMAGSDFQRSEGQTGFQEFSRPILPICLPVELSVILMDGSTYYQCRMKERTNENGHRNTEYPKKMYTHYNTEY